jgi:hypothetical protein
VNARLAPERRQYYRAAATFWLGALHLQRDRCTVPKGKDLCGPEADTHRADMDFFVVAVKRLRAVACQARDRLPDSGPIREAIERFDRRLARPPRRKELLGAHPWPRRLATGR